MGSPYGAIHSTLYTTVLLLAAAIPPAADRAGAHEACLESEHHRIHVVHLEPARKICARHRRHSFGAYIVETSLGCSGLKVRARVPAKSPRLASDIPKDQPCVHRS